MASSVVEVPGNYIPSNYDDLYRTFRPFVTRLVTHYNRVPSNFDDLLAHIWMKIIENQVIEKYHSVGGGSMPKLMTSTQACAYLGISWGSFKMSLWRYFHGDDRQKDKIRSVKKFRDVVEDHDQGVCSCCGQDMSRLEKILAKGRVYPDDFEKAFGLTFNQALADMRIHPKQRNLWYVETIVQGGKRTPKAYDPEVHKTICYICWERKKGEACRSRANWAPTPVEGTWASKTARYSREDLDRFRMLRDANPRRTQPKGPTLLSTPVLKTRGAFKLYLARAVHNIYANWCRTRDRRYKESYPGVDVESGKAWEDTLEDTSGVSQESLLSLYEATKLLAYGRGGKDQGSKVHEDLLAMVAEGHNISDVVSRLSLPRHYLNLLHC